MFISRLIRFGAVGLLAVSVVGVIAEDARADHYARRSHRYGGSYSGYSSSYSLEAVVRYGGPSRVYREYRPDYYVPSHSATVVYDARPVRYAAPRHHIRIERPRRYVMRPIRRERHSRFYFELDRRHQRRYSVGLRIGRTLRDSGHGGFGIRVHR